ncbi:hypothetical protein [Achromobacter arsenitoxydans]|uniref:Lipoprotein n=1 Tax=Achromobacter arsenitoxydans SY8 TaxID=477184 RepID=H0F4Q2_9BURK|nr:hypothetical protein [Achromobacter arsenitoxydans]EHK66703.1 hypothetical protein KYC_08720 [Achromobacter arsenitoxydans SY8]
MLCKRNSLATWQSQGKLASALAVAALLSGCSISQGLCDAAGPAKSATISIPQGASTEDVFACIDRETIAKGEDAYYLDKGYAIRDTSAGVLETEHYRTSNVTGFRLRAEVSNISTLKLSLRGAGAYCADPGVDKEMARLQSAISGCLAR